MARRGALARLAMWVAVLALGSLALWQYRREQAAAAGTLLGRDPATITEITLAFAGFPVEHYRRLAGQWRADDGTPADQGLLAELADIAQAPVAQWRPASDFEPALIGLQPPSVRLRLGSTWLDFGTEAVTGPLCYVRVRDRIALVPLRYRPRPPQSQTLRLH